MFNLDAFLSEGTLIGLGHDTVLLAWGMPTQFANEQDLDSTKPSFYYPDFFLKKPLPWFQYPFFKEFLISDFIKLFTSEFLPSAEWKISHKQTFQSSFLHLQNMFTIGTLQKAVPYTFSHSAENMCRSRLKKTLLQALLSSQKFPCTIYGRWNATSGIMGVTPETLFQHHALSPHRVHTMALAGTLATNKELVDLKLHHEHQIVVDAISEALRSFGEVRTQPMELLKLSRLTHLKTPIELLLSRPFNFTETVKALHPTPALGAYPRAAGWQWLENYHTQIERSHFGAPIGVLYKDLAQCIVAIRQVQWNEEGMRIGAGCGVVKESQCEEEWNEIELKISAIKELLAL